MTTTDEQLQDQADQLDDLARRLAALEGRQAVVARTELEARLTPGTPARAGDGTVLGGLALGMVSSTAGNVAPYASTVRAVGIVTVLPTLPHPDYPVGSTVVLTTNGQFYRNDAEVWTAVVAELLNSNGNVSIGPGGIVVTNGAIVVNNGAIGVGTVIIDGTSDMFKIVASGTLSKIGLADNTDSFTTTTLTGAAPGGTVPAHIGQIYTSYDASRALGQWLRTVWRFVALTSGGAVTEPMIAITFRVEVTVEPTGTDDLDVQMYGENRSGLSKNFNGRWYVLKEAGI